MASAPPSAAPLANRIELADQNTTQVTGGAAPYTDWKVTELINHSNGILAGIYKSLDSLRGAQKGEAFDGIVDYITGSVGSVLTVQYLVGKMQAKAEDVEEVMETQEELTQRGRTPRAYKPTLNATAMNRDDNEDGDWELEEETDTEAMKVVESSSPIDSIIDFDKAGDEDVFTSLANDPVFEEWMSAQMLLHAAELRYHVWDAREDAAVAENGVVRRGRVIPTDKEEAVRLKKEARAVEVEAKEFEDEGQRRKAIEEQGLREPWADMREDTTETEYVPMLMLDGVMRPWDWRLNVRGHAK